MSGPPAGDGLRGAGRDAPLAGAAQEAGPLSLLAIVGPTGTGKSELAYRVSTVLGGEIVNCDALQVYRGLDAATAKPTAGQRGRVTHHLVDCVDPRTDFSMADWVRSAERAIGEIAARGRVPVVAGGTGMYLRGLLRGVVEAPARDGRLRARIRAIGQRRGTAALHRWLSRLDPRSAARVPPRDAQRVARAIEFALVAGTTWSARLEREGTWAEGAERFRSLKIGLTLDRAALYERLDRRVEAFFAAGLVAEVRGLLAAGVPPEANALKAIGYREVLAALRAGHDPAATVEQVQRSTRRYAKRQLTWFRGERGVEWLDVGEGIEPLVAEICERWDRARRTSVR